MLKMKIEITARQKMDMMEALEELRKFCMSGDYRFNEFPREGEAEYPDDCLEMTTDWKYKFKVTGKEEPDEDLSN